jgi:thioredoxin 1
MTARAEGSGKQNERSKPEARTTEGINHMADVIEVSDSTFETEVLNSDTPVIIDFWAELCAPCRAIAPIIKDLAAEYDGKVKIVKMNIDESPATPGRYAVRAIPTVLAIKGGEVVGQIQGARPKAEFVKLLDGIV